MLSFTFNGLSTVRLSNIMLVYGKLVFRQLWWKLLDEDSKAHKWKVISAEEAVRYTGQVNQF